MATTNTYTNAKAILRGNTTVYTAPSSGTSIIKSIRVSNTEESNDRDVTITITDSSSVVYYLELNRTIQKGSSQGRRPNTSTMNKSKRRGRTKKQLSYRGQGR